MGLDMYLTGKRYISKYFDDGDTDRANIIAEQFPELRERKGRWGDDSPVKGVSIEAGYWRKANQIHKWFVDNVQGGQDDCGYYRVSREQLEELRDLCRQVLDFRHLATDRLPPQEGFFFGSKDIDEWYWQDVEQTIQIIEDALSLPDTWDFEYHSSW
jgi:hypothetical protein